MKSVQASAALAAAILLSSTSVSLAQAQGQTGTTNTSRNLNTTGGAAAGAGGSLIDQNLFSTGGDVGTGIGQLGTGAGRFQGNQLATQPLAGQNTAANQSFNRLLQVQTLQQTNRLGSQFGGGTSSRLMMRPSLRLGFAITKRPSAEISSSISRRFDKLTSRFSRLADTRPAFSAVKIAVSDDGAIVLSGQVESDSAKRLAANMLRMEAGVRSVKNELVVVPPQP